MKSKHIPLILIILINIGFLLSVYWFPVTRDEFYYLDKSKLPYIFSEYWISYIEVNPRIGQFFGNAIGRSKFLKLIFSFFLFNGFFIALFANVFRRLPNLSQKDDGWKFLILTASFIFLINYFGELFYYNPFASNYTFTHVLYFFYLFAVTEYFFSDKIIFPKKPLGVVLILIISFVIGMGNEHVPPVLLLFSAICGLIYLLKNKKLPDYRIILVNVMIAVGYLCLFFAPANAIKYNDVGKTQYGFSMHDYISTFIKICKTYYYYNFDLILLVGISILGLFYVLKKKWLKKQEVYLLMSLMILAGLALLVISYSPLTGTRLMFFSTISVFIFAGILVNKFAENFKINLLLIRGLASFWLIVFFAISVIICFNANQKFEEAYAEIAMKSQSSKNVVMSGQINYFHSYFSKFNRRILFESGADYIDDNTKTITSEEKNIIRFFKLKTLSHQ